MSNWDIALHGSTWERPTACSTRHISYLRSISARGFTIACPEEVAYVMNYIDESRLKRGLAMLGNSEYRRYLRRLLGR